MAEVEDLTIPVKITKVEGGGWGSLGTYRAEVDFRSVYKDIAREAFPTGYNPKKDGQTWLGFKIENINSLKERIPEIIKGFFERYKGYGLTPDWCEFIPLTGMPESSFGQGSIYLSIMKSGIGNKGREVTLSEVEGVFYYAVAGAEKHIRRKAKEAGFCDIIRESDIKILKEVEPEHLEEE